MSMKNLHGYYGMIFVRQRMQVPRLSFHFSHEDLQLLILRVYFFVLLPGRDNSSFPLPMSLDR